jgi:salicylate hydroxylase
MQVIVVGGGVAGTVAAIAFRQRGADVTIVEAYPDPGGDVGSFLSLATNGLRGLAAINCLDRVRAVGFTVARQRLWTGSGALLGDTPRARLAADSLFSVTLARSRLVAELRAAATEAGVQLVTGERVVDIRPEPPGVRAWFASGRTATGDLVVGADGIWSTARSIVDPTAPTPVYAGLYSVSGVARATGNSNGGDEAGVFNMTFGRNGSFIHLHTPEGEIWWQAQIASPLEPTPEELDDTRVLRRLAELYAREATPSAVIGATTRLHRPTRHHALEPVPTWYRDNIVLIGDAAHPVGAGQGASMAIEDGLVLASAVGGASSVGGSSVGGSSVADGLAEYQRIRRPRVPKMLKAARENRETKKAGPIGRAAQRVIMPIVLRHFYEKATGWLYRYDVTTDLLPNDHWAAKLGR